MSRLNSRQSTVRYTPAITGPPSSPSEIPWDSLSTAAWSAREQARIHGTTSVGAAVLARDERIYSGCNVEHRYRSHDIHAEVNALTTMIAGGSNEAIAVLVVSEREGFTPCGACMDWVFELGGPRCLVGAQAGPGAELFIARAEELMPHYPA